MKLEFTKEEVELVLLDYANRLLDVGEKPFNAVSCGYSSIPATVVVEHVTETEATS